MSMTFSSTAHGTPTPTVQWQVSSDHGATWSFLPGASSGTLQLSNVTAAQNGLEYRAVWTSSGGATDSQPAMLTVNTAPVIDESPASLAVAEGDDAVFTSAASGNPAPTVQWELSTNQGASWTPVPGASASSLTVNSVTLAQTGAEYRAVWTNVVRSVPSSAATLTVDARPTVAMVGASAITATSAILNGTVDPNGAIVESCAFRWGTNPDPRQFEESEECESLPAGLAGAQAVSTLAEGLEPNTTYYYYLKADNALGDSDGVASEVFTTLASSGSGTSSGVSAVARDGTLSATAGGSSGSVTVGHYGSAFTGTGPLRGNGEFFDVYLSSGNTFSKLEFTVCGLQPSDTLEWDNGGAWDKVERQKHEVGSPGCVEVEIEGPGDGTSPELAQMTGTIFAVVTPAESLPVVGRCTKLPGTKVGRTTVYDGAYTSNKCITKNLAGTGGYEWTPATGSNAFVGTGATVTIDAGGKPRITCRAISDSGAYSGTDQETTDITLSECATSGRGATSCHSAGQGAGAIAWSPLAGGIGLVNAVQAQAGVDFAAPAAGEPLASFECGGTAERLEGSVIGEASVDTSSIRQSVKFKAVRGAQAIQALEGGATDTLTLASGPGFSHTEPAALSGTLEQETTEPLEIKALLAPFSLTASATSGPVGSTVKLTGSGYIPGDTITPKFQGNNPVPHEPKITTTYPPVTVNASGEFEAEITIPTTVGIGAGKLSITSRHTGATLTETFNVTPPTT